MSSSIDEETLRLIKLFKPVKDAEQSWKIDVSSEISCYIEILEQQHLDSLKNTSESDTVDYIIGENGVNFSQASTLLVEATKVFSRKVDFLKKQLDTTLSTMFNGSKTEMKQKNKAKKGAHSMWDPWFIDGCPSAIDLMHVPDAQFLWEPHYTHDACTVENEETITFPYANSESGIKTILEGKHTKYIASIPLIENPAFIGHLRGQCGYSPSIELIPKFIEDKVLQTRDVLSLYSDWEKTSLALPTSYSMFGTRIFTTVFDVEKFENESKPYELAAPAVIEMNIGASNNDCNEYYDGSVVSDVYNENWQNGLHETNTPIPTKESHFESATSGSIPTPARTKQKERAKFIDEHQAIGKPLKISIGELGQLNFGVVDFSIERIRNLDVLMYVSGGIQSIREYIDNSEVNRKLTHERFRDIYQQGNVLSEKDLELPSLSDCLPLFPQIKLHKLRRGSSTFLTTNNSISTASDVGDAGNFEDSINHLLAPDGDDPDPPPINDNDINSVEIQESGLDVPNVIGPVRRGSLMKHSNEPYKYSENESRLIALYERLSTWRTTVDDWIEFNKEQGLFDIQVYMKQLRGNLKESAIDNKLEIKFSEYCGIHKLRRHEVCRYFLTSLFLVNRNMLEIHQDTISDFSIVIPNVEALDQNMAVSDTLEI